MLVDKFTNKLNCIEGKIYTVEEEITLVNGTYKSVLAHDNVTVSSVNVYSGSKLTGDKIENVLMSIPSETPWKIEIEIFASYEKVYITYETIGDTVEAEDINVLQDSIVKTQLEVNKKMDAHEHPYLPNTYIPSWSVISGKPSSFNPSTHSHSIGDLPSGVYEPVITKKSGFNLALGTTIGTVSEGNHAHSNYANASHAHTKANITDFPMLSSVATSGSYADLSNKPTIPTKFSQLENDIGIGGLPSYFTWNMLKGV